MKRTALLIASLYALLAASTGASPVSAATSGNRYWTIAHAVAAAKATATVPYCRIYQCVNGKPFVSGDTPTPAHLATVSCVGVGTAVGGRYRRFSCKFALVNDTAFGRITMYIAGPTAFRWKVECASHSSSDCP